ncbi:oligoribonuclease [Corynebacterium pyruviciproducens]|uniref:Oligoribonuclease n=1 Tax=Corynebacterium pyruviciproducens TaxID=598660 RepID=A0AAF0YVK5_9CORY|nr:oligoribonuclease [Corynebacterium pyruviciproducens]MDH4658734.1 oligoribonuclease [Corynebacterium pyruviciproducens]MDK6567040.1 oligoribonuclease [Corynebacterium pyruviciproducens]MDK7215299.1 oligoribonuclease [Corynebacterium pyruviciproducens]WOT02709.1 oligoribonuclease [Corynebacterium pyruviciproducens]
MSNKDNHIVWIDLEMTGLDPKRHVIVEAAVHVTDNDLTIVGDGLDLVIHATAEELTEMDDVVTKMHTSNGLVEEITASTLTCAEAEKQIIAYIDEHCESRPILAGNSIATDRSFIREYMPALDARLHYRMIDVSSLKVLALKWMPTVYSHQPKKGLSHRALADIVESIKELDYYRRCMLRPEAGDTATAARQADERYKDYLAF